MTTTRKNAQQSATTTQRPTTMCENDIDDDAGQWRMMMTSWRRTTT